ncbi:hypothetical protein ABPG74_019889 [Tetrahymena malaccensis]
MSQLALIEERRKKIDKQTEISKSNNLKAIQYGYVFTKEINNPNIFQIAGDITINIDQLLNQDYVALNSSWNEFIQVNQVKLCNTQQIVDVYIDTDVQVRTDLSIPIYLLKRSQRQDLYNLANLIEEFQNTLNEKCQNNCDLYSSYQNQQMIDQSETISEQSCDEYHGWNFQKSVEKAEKVIEDLIESMKNSDNNYSFILFKGNKYDQSIYRVGNSKQFLKDFICLNDDQISYLGWRKPTLFFLKYQHQLISYLCGRIKNQIRFLKQENSDLDYYREGLKFLNESTINIQSIDNFSVEVKQHQYLYILSNYKNQVDDVLWVSKIQPIRNQSASQVLWGMRNLKKYLNNEQINSKLNAFQNGQIYTDILYEAQSELFRDKYYSILDNNLYHQVTENF